MHLFVRDYNVHVVDASQAMVRDGEQAVCVGWKVDADDAWALVGDHVEKTRVLMGKPVMILKPTQ
jgi:hypothetical protein